MEPFDALETFFEERNFSLNRMPFSDWVLFRLAESSLCPHEHSFRVVKDLGSISTSLNASEIDLLDRPFQKDPLQGWLQTAKKAVLFVVAFYTILPMAAFGICHHGLHVAAYSFESLFEEGEGVCAQKAINSYQRMYSDIARLSEAVALPLSLLFLDPGRILGGGVLTRLFNTGWQLTAFSVMCSILNTPISAKGVFGSFPVSLQSKELMRALVLKKEFGVVSSEKGELLSFQKGDSSDYFEALCEDTRKEYLQAMNVFRKSLPRKVEDAFLALNFWQVKEYVPFFAAYEEEIGLSKEEVDFWKERLILLGTRYHLSKRLLEL